MSEQQPGQANAPQVGETAVPPIVGTDYYEAVGAYLASGDTPTSALGEDPLTVHRLFTESRGKRLTPASTYRVLERVAEGPIDLEAIKGDVLLPSEVAVHTVNYLADNNVVGKHKWILALEPGANRNSGNDWDSLRGDKVNAMLRTVESLSVGQYETIYVTKSHLLKHMTELYPELEGTTSDVWNALLPEIRRQEKLWAHGIEVVPEAGKTGRVAVALTPEFQTSIKVLVARFEATKQTYSSVVLDPRHNPSAKQLVGDAQQRRYELDDVERAALLQQGGTLAVKGATAEMPIVDEILEGDFAFAELFWPRIIFGYGYQLHGKFGHS